MFLRAQHFQQQDRWLEQLVRSRAAAMGPYWWGVSEIAVNRDDLAIGRFSLSSATGVFQDGTPFAIPGDADDPLPLDLQESTRNALVFLAVPAPPPHAVQVALNGAGDEGRYAVHDFKASDTHSGSPEPADLIVGRLRLRYMLETDDRSGYQCIGVARIREVASDRRASLDDNWIVPALRCAAVPPLGQFITELSGMLNQRGEALAARLTGSGTRGVAEQGDFLLLQVVNRWQKLLSHWADAGAVHPEELYATLVQIVGEFATFTETSRRPANYPAYRHEDLQRSFAPVIADLRRSLRSVDDPSAVQIPLQELRHGVRRGTLVDRRLLTSSVFYLTAQADMPGETLRRVFPAQVKIGAIEQLRELVNVALPGITVQPLPVAPRQIPFYAGASYFELDRGSSHWEQMKNSAGFGIHVSSDFPNLKLELWAVRT
jgi:type VI secretion system protein ImpJ